MRLTLVVFLFSLLAGMAQAQVQCWTNAAGKRECGDTPPPGAKVREIRTPLPPAQSGAPASKAAAKDAAKDAKQGPLTPAEQEQAYRKRQIDAEKARDKEEKERADAVAKKDNCDRARESLRSLESGQRVSRTDASGERVFLEDAQVAAETAKAREAVKQWCN